MNFKQKYGYDAAESSSRMVQDTMKLNRQQVVNDAARVRAGSLDARGALLAENNREALARVFWQKV